MRFRPLNRNLRIFVAQIRYAAIKRARVVANPVEVFFASPRVDHQQVVILAEPVHNHIVHKCPLRIEQRRILRLSDRQARSVIHADMLHRIERLRSDQPNIPHVADVENTHARAHSHVLGNESARLRVLDRHIPAAKSDHLRAHGAVNRIQGSLANARRTIDSRHIDLNR